MTIGSGLVFIGVALACVWVAYFEPLAVLAAVPIGIIMLAACHDET
jgi:hypothetical protein